jgi:tetratricopeptide (TPR) repeat protein
VRSTLPFWIFLLAASSLGANSQTRKFELNGKIVQSDGKPFQGVTPQVFLHGSLTPFATQTLAGVDGRFKFKNLLAGPYTLIAAVPRAGELYRTVEISSSLADSKGRITTTLMFEPATTRRKDLSVSAAELSVPANARQEYNKARNLLEKRDIERAKACLKKAVTIAPQFSIAWNNLGVIAYQSGQFAQAEEYFREALKQDPESYSPLVNLGGALLSQGKDRDSLTVNQQAVKIKPDDALAHSQLGQSYFYLDQLDEAERHLKQAKSLDPAHFSFPQLVLVQIYARRQNLPALAEEMKEFLRLHPDAKQAPEIRKSLEKVRALQAQP